MFLLLKTDGYHDILVGSCGLNNGIKDVKEVFTLRVGDNSINEPQKKEISYTKGGNPWQP